MLKKLASWLRIAGYDVIVMPDGTSDRDIVNKAMSEKRILLTRDQKIAEFKLAEIVAIILECNDLEDCVGQLNHKLRVNWLYQPFTRCNSCNTVLVKAGRDQIQRITEKVRDLETGFLFCPVCNQLFWEGTHVVNMRKQLERWNGAH
ncbi:MAG: hypothetical protein HKP55_02795 [Gammaproteobacteria bacterium]|nr:Mut7-C RNAse domain-containing protein [Gammaproteobacteria bacterium]NNJ90580.1 hypothetical protein [Gammaproteobacteria bacterium]